MDIIIDGKFAGTISKSDILGLSVTEISEFYIKAYRKLFPKASITIK